MHPVTHMHPISSQSHPNPPSFHPPKPSLHTGPKGHTNRHRAWHIPASCCHGCSPPAVPALHLARLQSRPWLVPGARFGQISRNCTGRGTRSVWAHCFLHAMVSYDRHAECRLGGWGYLSDFEMRCEDLVEAPGFRCSSSCSQTCRIGWH